MWSVVSKWSVVVFSLTLFLAGANATHAGSDSEAELVRQLGDANFNKREAAAAALLKQGEAARTALEKALSDSTDAEVRRRAQKLIQVLDRERRLASGMHVVGLYEACGTHFRLLGAWGRDIDWPRFSTQLLEQGKNDAPSPSKRLWELLTDEARETLGNKRLMESMKEFPPADRGAIIAQSRLNSALTQALSRPDFYQEKHFAGVQLDDEGRQLLQRHKDLTLLETWVLNRRLLEAAFGAAVKRTGFSLDKATAHVVVPASKNPITLVLCSYESVRWSVQAEKGAKIEKVIVGGYHLQDVVGTTAPISYHVYERPGNRSEPRYFFAYRADDESYGRLVESLRQITDKEIASFQGRYSYGQGAPFVIGPRE